MLYIYIIPAEIWRRVRTRSLKGQIYGARSKKLWAGIDAGASEETTEG